MIRWAGIVRWSLLLAVVSWLPACSVRPEVVTGTQPPGLACSDLTGDAVVLERLKGKVVVIFFWSGVCCGETVRQLQPLYGRSREKGLEIVAVNVGESREAVARYAADNGLTFTVALDEHVMSSWLYSIKGVPTVFILDRGGIVREKILGDVKVEMLGHLAGRYL